MDTAWDQIIASEGFSLAEPQLRVSKRNISSSPWPLPAITRSVSPPEIEGGGAEREEERGDENLDDLSLSLPPPLEILQIMDQSHQYLEQGWNNKNE